MDRFDREMLDLGIREAPATPWGPGETTPKPIRLTHHHVRKAVQSGALLSDSAPGPMNPSRMKPGYVDVAHPSRQSLQKAVTDLINASYSAAISPAVHLRLSVVDLTEGKHHAPVFAGFWTFGAGAAVEGGSLPKILALHALFQLRFDLNSRATRDDLRTSAALIAAVSTDWKKEGMTAPPKLRTLFRFAEKSGSPVEAAIRIGTRIHHNHVARAMILALGFEYIGSVALQSGLFDETQGGLWLNAAYGEPRVTWRKSPFPNLERHNVTALAAATFFTLLAQGRLADQATSNDIARVLKRVKCADNGLLDGIHALPGAEMPSANKCGILKGVFHEAIHVKRKVPATGRNLEYVVALLTRKPPRLNFVQLGADIDRLIAAANP